MNHQPLSSHNASALHDDRRDGRRFQFASMTRISVSDSAATPDAGRCIAVLGRDISCTGIGVVSSVPIALGTRLRVELPRVSGEVDCYDAIVNRCRPVAEALFDVGAVFVEAIPVTQYVVIT